MKRLFSRISITLVFTIVSMWLIIFFMPLAPLLAGLPYSQAVYDEHERLLRLTLSEDQQFRLYTPLKQFPKPLIEATLLQEDQYYYWHPGVNPISLVRAATQTYFGGSRRFGASTITMQVARLRYRINSKTFTGKCWQIIRALQIEAHYSKRDILETYLNLAPYGGNIQGASAASELYFSKSVAHLSLPEILTLVVIPQNPLKRTPDRGHLQQARQLLFDRWILKHPTDRKQQPLFDLPLQMLSTHDAPFHAPHFVNQLLTTYPDEKRINSTLDYTLQEKIERIVTHYLDRKSSYRVNNAAVMLVDTRNMEVKALVGSASFYNAAILGQVDGSLSYRSPGSALKPFIYALALDQGLIHPDTVLKDVPHSYGSYNPENFDKDFNGPIKAKDALVLSRNIPAVTLAEQLKQPSLYDFLQQAGINHLKSEKFYGLALALGGAEISMQELTELYAVLANRGEWRSLRFTQAQENAKGKQLLSPEASYLILDMLQETDKPQAFIHDARVPVAWKTGTSSGFRDAWTVGIVGPYVLTVWIGNFNNQSNPAFIGKEIAAPLFFEIISSLRERIDLKYNFMDKRGLHLTQVDVCKVSGMLPNHYCSDTEKTWFIPGKSPIKVDNIHREVAIDKRTGLRACQFNENTYFDVYEFWSSDLLAIFKRAGLQRRSPPALDPACALSSKIGDGFSPQITSPQTEIKYVARISDKSTPLPFTAVVDGDVKNLYWFLNAAFLGKTSRDKPFIWQAKPGHFVIRVVDDYGRSDAQDIDVLLEK